VGIAPEELTRVFDMFHQADPVLARSNGGLGIGLTLAQRLVKLHHGEIDVRSPGVGKGTEVEIRLPISAAPIATAVTADIPPIAVTRQLRALIVEDNVDAAEMMNVAVTHLGHLTRVAHDGASAIAAAKELHLTSFFWTSACRTSTVTTSRERCDRGSATSISPPSLAGARTRTGARPGTRGATLISPSPSTR
jgi:hypothetical protein